jgi:hypothetical protein
LSAVTVVEAAVAFAGEDVGGELGNVSEGDGGHEVRHANWDG